MSYSRWLNSDFYTFWASSTATCKEDELFVCMYSIEQQLKLKYQDIVSMLQNIESFRKMFLDELGEEPTPTQELELIRYFNEFVADVNKYYDREGL